MYEHIQHLPKMLPAPPLERLVEYRKEQHKQEAWKLMWHLFENGPRHQLTQVFAGVLQSYGKETLDKWLDTYMERKHGKFYDPHTKSYNKPVTGWQDLKDFEREV